jgi:hypothetical protein
MDPDTVLTQPVLPQVIPLLENHDAIFSGQPVWQEDSVQILPQGFNRVLGRYGYSREGVFLGYSYFCIYRNRRLNHVIKSRGWSFDRIHFKNLPPMIRLLLVKMKNPGYYYDTGKVLNTLLREDGAKLVYSAPEGHYHLGGIALRIRDRQQENEIDFGKFPDVRVKVTVGKYFLQCLDALEEDRPLPSMPRLENERVFTRVRDATRYLADIYHDTREKFHRLFQG